MFRPIGQFNTWNLSTSGADPLEKLKIIIDQLSPFPPEMGYYRRIYNECDTADLFVQELAHRSQVILNCAYPTLDLHWQREWGYFDGRDTDASIDLIWRVVDDGKLMNVAITEFKRAGSITVAHWEGAMGRFGKLPKKAREQSQQVTRYSIF